MKLSDRVTPELLRIKGELEQLQKLRIKVGIQGDADSEILTIARVHEYGAVIHAKQAKNLCIPISKESYDKSPRDFPDLFFIRSKNGYLLGVTAKKRRKRKKKGGEGPSDDLNLLFLLLPSVTILSTSSCLMPLTSSQRATSRRSGPQAGPTAPWWSPRGFSILSPGRWRRAIKWVRSKWHSLSSPAGCCTPCTT